VWAALGTFLQGCRFYTQHLPSGQEGGAVAVSVRARLPSPGPSQLSDSSSRRKRHRARAPSPITITVALLERRKDCRVLTGFDPQSRNLNFAVA
jgi:hypothetical protein